MTRRRILTTALVIIAIGMAGYAAHSLDLLGLARSVHGG